MWRGHRDAHDSAVRAMSRTARLIGLLAAVALGAGCTSQSGSSGTETALASAELASLHSLAQASETSTQLRKVHEELVRRCMVAKGSPYVIGYVPSQYSYTPYRGLSVDEASQLGYRGLLGHTPEGDAADERIQKLQDSMTPAEIDKQILDLSGDPSSPRESVRVGDSEVSYPTVGCQYEADQKLFGDVRAWNQAWLTVSRAGIETSAQVEASPLVKAAGARWAGCMASENRVYDAPGDAMAAGVSMSSVDENGGRRYNGPTPAEKALAVADATCRASTGYDATLSDVTNAAVARYARANEGQVLTLIELNEKAQRRAQELLR